MKQPCAVILFLASVLALTPRVFAESRAETYFYILDITGGTREEQLAFQEALKAEIRSAGYSVTEDILDADYAVNCAIRQNGPGRVLDLGVFDVRDEREILATDLDFVQQETLFAGFPMVVRTLFANVPLKSRPIAVDPPEKKPGKVLVEREVPAERVDPANAWKYQWMFVGARAGISNRYYMSRNVNYDNAAIFTFDLGIEPEVHLFDFLAIQFGLDFTLDRAEYTLNRSPFSYSTYMLSVPLMVKYVLNAPRRFTTGVFLGPYFNIRLMGPAAPPPAGIVFGLDFSIKTGPGALVLDLRYSSDFGNTDIPGITQYNRMFITLSAGYKFGFLLRRP